MLRTRDKYVLPGYFSKYMSVCDVRVIVPWVDVLGVCVCVVVRTEMWLFLP